jgi:hypothetical protein
MKPWEDGKIETCAVNSPLHYKHNHKGIEAIDAIEAAMQPSQFKGYLKGNLLKYIWRCDYKGHAVQDLKKAEWYLKRLIATYEAEI